MEATATRSLPALPTILSTLSAPVRSTLLGLRRPALDWLLELRRCQACGHEQFVGNALLSWSGRHPEEKEHLGLDCELCGQALLRCELASIRQMRRLP